VVIGYNQENIGIGERMKPMTEKLKGIHHITAIAGEPQKNIDFYSPVLGLRLVKLTVNFDDNGRYHLYFGDEEGTPGTILTFFSWPGSRPGKVGAGQISEVAYTVPQNSLTYWHDRLQKFEVAVERPVRRFDEEVMAFYDPDGLRLELIAREGLDGLPVWENGPVPSEHALRGFHTAALQEQDPDPVTSLLTDHFGYRLVGEEAGYRRMQMEDGNAGAYIDIRTRPEADRGTMGAGAVHHIAFRTPDDEKQLEWQQELTEAGFNVTKVMDRQYFRSIYFREPGGVLFEIATDIPGFAIDEPVEALGSGLRLPPWLEDQRAAIVKALPEVRLPEYLHQKR
jgi:glyoxalase family protein